MGIQSKRKHSSDETTHSKRATTRTMRQLMLLLLLSAAMFCSAGRIVGGYACPLRDQDFYGNDIILSPGGCGGVPVSGWEACGTLCENVSNCQVWTYFDTKQCPRGCYLKSSERGLKYAPGRISGTKHCN